MLFRSQAKDEFEFAPAENARVNDILARCSSVYSGSPAWINEDDDIHTVNFAKSICAETARLTMLDTSVSVSGSSRADWIQQKLSAMYPKLRTWVEYACAYGTIILKPNDGGVSCYTPSEFILSGDDHRQSAVFKTQKYDDQTRKYYTRLEYHRFVGDTYLVTNKCYVSDTATGKGDPIDISATPWAELAPESSIDGLEAPLFAVLRMPGANNIDTSSLLSLPMFSDALEELKDLDIAYSRNAVEIEDSRRTVLLDSDRLIPSDGSSVKNVASNFDRRREMMKLPRYVRNVYGDGEKTFYQEINPQLNTEMRLTGINALLSQIGFKCGFSNGYFVFNEKTGMVTATQVESDDRRTIQLIKDIRDQLQACLNALIYALDKFADIFFLAPVGVYEVNYDFGDITYNEAEDKATWYGYVIAGKVPFWYYLVKFEGMTEEEAKALESEAQPKTLTLFGAVEE